MKPAHGSDRLVWSVFKTGLRFLLPWEVKDLKSVRHERLREGRRAGSLHGRVVQEQKKKKKKKDGLFQVCPRPRGGGESER